MPRAITKTDRYWMPAFAGMTWGDSAQRRRWNHQVSAARHSAQPAPLGTASGL